MFPKSLWILITFYFVLMGTVVSFRHYNFQTQTWDMGVFAQTYWNTIHGKIMQNSLEEVPNTLGVHMSPWLFILLPGYLLFQSPYYLLLIQTLALALGALPLYALAKKICQHLHIALALSASYLLYPSLHWINFFDFHPVTFFVPLALYAFYFATQEHWKLSALFFVLAASTREDAIVVIVFMGLSLFVLKKIENKDLKSKLPSIFIALGALIYFICTVWILMPAFGGGLLRIDRYSQFGHTGTEILGNIIRHPSLLISTIFTKAKIAYAIWLFIPGFFLSLLYPPTAIMLIPGLAENLLTNFSFQFSGLYQYDSVIIPVFFLSLIYGVRTYINRYPKHVRSIPAFLIISSLVAFFFRSPLNPLYFPYEMFSFSNPHWNTFRSIVHNTPPNISISAHTNLVPHLANRSEIYMLGTEPHQTDMVIIDGADGFGFSNDQEFEHYVQTYLNSPEYTGEIIENRYIVIRRKNLSLPHSQ